MGRDKATLPINGKTMSLTLAEKYKPLGPVAFSVDRKGRFPVGEYMELPDHFPGCGPLNGIISAFLDTEENVVFLTATDMPGGDTETVHMLLRRMEDCDACILRGEPLFGVYRRSCLSAALDCLKAGQYSLRVFLERLRVRELDYENKETTVNLNTPEEYSRYIENT